MIVFITGATGFIGGHLARALADNGHEIICAVRHPDSPRARALPGRRVRGDFARDLSPAHWRLLLAGVDVVINAAGILRERGEQRFDTLHVKGPRALFEASVQAGVGRIIQISALGADGNAQSRYHLSKKQADDFLLDLPLSATVVQPSLIYGPGGESARFFTLLASLPAIPVPGDGRQPVQPLHVDDAVAVLVVLAERDVLRGQRVALAGPAPMALRDFLLALRGALGLAPCRVLPVPIGLVRLGAALGRWMPSALLDRETLAMLERGNTAPSDTTRVLLGRAPRAAADFIAAGETEGARVLGQLGWLLPLLRWSIAAVWIVTGIVSLGVYPVQESYALLARVGIAGALAPVMLYGAALLDLVFGIATLTCKRRRWLWIAQLAVIGLYTALITIRLPEFWLHPYGPILKNLPMLAGIGVLLALEEKKKR